MASARMGSAIATIHGQGKAVGCLCVQTTAARMVCAWMGSVSVMMVGWVSIAQKGRV